MKYRSICFITPRFGTHLFHHQRTAPPIGIGCLAECLSKVGVASALIDLSLVSDDEAFRRLSKNRPDVIGISAITLGYKDVYAFAQKLKTQFPEIPVIVGGPHASAFRRRILDECNEIDAVFLNEAEESLPRWMQGDDESSIPGFIARQGDGVVENPPQELTDLDLYPFPRYTSLHLDDYSLAEGITLISSRGCPFQCGFCESRTVLGPHWRPRSAESIFEEIKYWASLGLQRIRFADDNFAMDHRRVETLCRLIIQEKLNHIRYTVAGMRADRRNIEILPLMKEAGFDYLSFGIESASNRVLQRMKKQNTIEDMESVCQRAIDLGFEVKIYLLVGYPGERWDDFERSVFFALKHLFREVTFHLLLPIPGTDAFKIVQKEGCFLISPEEYLNTHHDISEEPVFNAPGMSVEEKVRAIRIARRTEDKVMLRYYLGRILGSFGAWFGGLTSTWHALRVYRKLKKLCVPLRRQEHA